MNKYEMGVILRADLEEEVFHAEMDRVKGLIDRFGGTIEKVDEWGRRKLAYPIQKLTEGMYTFITYQSEGPTPAQVEDRLKLMENVLRFLTIRKDEKEVAAEDAKAEAVAEAATAESSATEEAVEEAGSADTATNKEPTSEPEPAAEAANE